MSKEAIRESLITLLEDYHDFNSSPIEVRSIPTPVEFAKQVSKGYPCIYQAYTKTANKDGTTQLVVDGNLLKCPCYTWNKQDLTNLLPEEVEIAITPTGRADDIHHVDDSSEPVFLAPATINMTISDLFDKLNLSSPTNTPPSSSNNETNSTLSLVYYLQSQNSNTTTTPFRHLSKHIPPTLSFADSGSKFPSCQ